MRGCLAACLLFFILALTHTTAGFPHGAQMVLVVEDPVAQEALLDALAQQPRLDDRTEDAIVSSEIAKRTSLKRLAKLGARGFGRK
ncbi:unnamed protein product, partial [Mesorhabditis spiculigera]